MDDITKHKCRIQAIIATRRISKMQLAKAAGMRDTVLIGIEDSDWNPRYTTLSKLVRAADKMGFPMRPGGRAARSLAA